MSLQPQRSSDAPVGEFRKIMNTAQFDYSYTCYCKSSHDARWPVSGQRWRWCANVKQLLVMLLCMSSVRERLLVILWRENISSILVQYNFRVIYVPRMHTNDPNVVIVDLIFHVHVAMARERKIDNNGHVLYYRSVQNILCFDWTQPYTKLLCRYAKRCFTQWNINLRII